MEFLFQYGLFIAKLATALFLVVFAIVVLKGASSDDKPKKLKVTDLSEQYKERAAQLKEQLYPIAQIKEQQKADKKAAKLANKAEKAAIKEQLKADAAIDKRDAHLFVIDFKGSIDAKEVCGLREEISAILEVAQENDEVLVRLESGGGMVHGYGLAASQLQRLRAANIKLTIAVDKVAASGGYMMACVGDKILAAPFAILGSIGVIAQLPNFNKVLKKNKIDFEQLTAGEYKRTLTMFGENTNKARAKFQEELEETHQLFKDFVYTNRPSLNVDMVANGEHWFGSKALELGLVDTIITSDDYVLKAVRQQKVLQISFVEPKTLPQKLAAIGANVVDQTILKVLDRGQRPFM